MFTNREINVLVGLHYAASHCEKNLPPNVYQAQFKEALSEYFYAYPDCDEDDEPFAPPEFPPE